MRQIPAKQVLRSVMSDNNGIAMEEGKKLRRCRLFRRHRQQLNCLVDQSSSSPFSNCPEPPPYLQERISMLAIQHVLLLYDDHYMTSEPDNTA